MKQVRNIVCIGLAVVMLLANTSTVNAATHKEGCNATLKAVVCGSLVGNVSEGSHMVYSSATGGYVTCNKTAEKHFHVIRCANSSCGAIYQTNVVRTCIIKHTQCTVQTGLCQY